MKDLVYQEKPDMSSYSASEPMLLSYRTITKAYRKPHMLFENKLACP
jgi:hypothetical protein